MVDAHRFTQSISPLKHLSISPSQRVWIYTLLVSITAALFGGDTGSIGSITQMPQFIEHFGELSEIMRGLVVASILIPSALTGICAGKVQDRISRKFTISLGSFIFAIGSAISCGAPNLGTLIAARVIAGSGEGLFLSSATCYLTEIAPKHIRGRVMSCYQLHCTGAIAIGFFVCYGSIKIPSSWAWRLPFALSTVFALISGICTPFLPYSPRFLCTVGRREEAEAVLDLITVPEDEQDRKDLLALPNTDKQLGWTAIFGKGVRGRTLLGVHLQVFQQLSGIDFVLFYAPLLFSQAGLDPATSSFIASGVTGLVMFAMSGIGALYVDRVGRRPLILWGGSLIAATLLAIGTICVNQAVNTVVALTSPAFLAKTPSGPYFLYGAFMLFGTIVAWLCMPETLGSSLESIDSKFEGSPLAVGWPSILGPKPTESLRNRRPSRRRSSAHVDSEGRPTFPQRMGMERLGSSALTGSAIAEE